MVYVKASTLWYWIAAVLILVWLCAFATSFGGGVVHLLPIIAAAMIGINLMKNRGAP
ncbi:MAG: hypothetical protein JWR80_6408 [Bradyrhizobium sp.]|nr:hypothetical protein [Bradyrhizobium sp.]